jgi:hypothetical protein
MIGQVAWGRSRSIRGSGVPQWYKVVQQVVQPKYLKSIDKMCAVPLYHAKRDFPRYTRARAHTCTYIHTLHGTVVHKVVKYRKVLEKRLNHLLYHPVPLWFSAALKISGGA